MKLPSNLPYKKYHKTKLKLNKSEHNFIYPKFCDFGLQALKTGKITIKQIESSRRVIRRFFKKNIYFKVNITPYAAITKKPVSARMGKGKGRHETWVAPFQKGKILFEITKPFFFVDRRDIKKSFTIVNSKLTTKMKFSRLIY